jgi:hypothetical protein
MFPFIHPAEITFGRRHQTGESPRPVFEALTRLRLGCGNADRWPHLANSCPHHPVDYRGNTR